jgi:hypothetical protein
MSLRQETEMRALALQRLIVDTRSQYWELTAARAKIVALKRENRQLREQLSTRRLADGRRR